MFQDLDDLKLFISYMNEHIKSAKSVDDALQMWISFKKSINNAVNSIKGDNNEIV